MKYLDGQERESAAGRQMRESIMSVEADRAVIRDYDYLARVVRSLSQAMR